MILAALGALNGHFAAVEAALREIDEAGIETVCCTGDLVAGGEDPQAVVECVRARKIIAVQGELDRLTVRYLRKKESLAQRLAPDVFDAIGKAYGALSSDAIEFLRGLPRTREFTLEGITFAVCHGTLTSAAVALTPDTSEEVFRRQRELSQAQIIISGGGPEPFSRWVGDTLFVCAGAVTCGGHGASYVLINTEQDPWEVEVRSVKV
jgi:predicted phosphodiesterase